MQILYNIILVACKLDEIFLRQNHTTITWPFHDGYYLPYLHEGHFNVQLEVNRGDTEI